MLVLEVYKIFLLMLLKTTSPINTFSTKNTLKEIHIPVKIKINPDGSTIAKC